MLLQLNKDSIAELLRDFHLLTGIRIVIFDDACNEVLSFPQEHCAFCSMMKADDETRKRCTNSDRASFASCRRSGQLVVYRCHAGLIEATAPIMDQGVLVGYFMLGQLRDKKDKRGLIRQIRQQHPDTAKQKDLVQALKTVPYRSSREIMAAAKILEAITSYVLLHDLISVKKVHLTRDIEAYIAAHLDQPLTSEQICRALHIGRTRLYELTRQSLGMGIAAYITLKRMALARTLLQETNLGIAQIAARTGYEDYTYFCKVFRKKHGTTPSDFRRIRTG